MLKQNDAEQNDIVDGLAVQENGIWGSCLGHAVLDFFSHCSLATSSSLHIGKKIKAWPCIHGHSLATVVFSLTFQHCVAGVRHRTQRSSWALIAIPKQDPLSHAFLRGLVLIYTLTLLTWLRIYNSYLSF